MTRAAWAAFALVLVAAPARAQEAGPLRLLIQGDFLVASQPHPAQDPADFSEGPHLGFRRVRVGDEVRGHDLHVRALFEAQPDKATGGAFPAPAGGQLPFGGRVRITEAFAGWAPHRGFEIDAGSLRVPFSLTRQIDEAYLAFPERPAFAEAFTADFRTGVAVGGDLGELLYRAAVLSADRTIDGQLFDAGYLLAGRITAEPLGPVGLTPRRRRDDDPWSPWFRFAAGLSVQYGTLAAPKTLAIDPDFTLQWRALVVAAEYLLSMRLDAGAVVPGSRQQGAVIEPGFSTGNGSRFTVLRFEWENAAGMTMWGAGVALTAYAPDPRWHVTGGLEWRWSQNDRTVAQPSRTGSGWFVLRLVVAID